MEPLSIRLGTLRRINLIFGITLVMMLIAHWLQFDAYFYFDSQLGTLIVPVAFTIIFFTHELGLSVSAYSNLLYSEMWFLSIFSIGYSFLSGNVSLPGFHIALLVVTVFAVENVSYMDQLILIYVAIVYPTVIIVDIEPGMTLAILTALSTVLLIGKIMNSYDFKVIESYQKTLKSKDLILKNSDEAFALHRMIYNEDGEAVDYEFLEVNSAFEAFTGRKCKEIIGKKVLEVFPHTEKHWIEMYGKVVQSKSRVKTIDYTRDFERYVEVTAYPVDEDCFAVLFSDITEKMEQDMKLKFAVLRSERADKLKTQFLRDVNHRLRTPLNGMMGVLQLIDMDDMGDENRELFRAMILEMRHSRNIINQIAKYVDIQEMDTEFTRGNIENIVEGCVRKIENQERVITVQYDKRVHDEFVYLEKNIVVAVLDEVLQNAIHHTREHKIDLSIWEDRHIEDGMNVLKISVKDYGVGIEADRLEYIFNEFYHDDFINIYKEVDKISLPMCKQMLINSGGNIYAESEYGVSTTITIEVPFFLQQNL